MSLFGSKEASCAPREVERITVLVVGGLQSAECVRKAEAALRALDGVESAGVNLLTRLSTVRHSSKIPSSALAAAVNAVGFHATPAKAESEGVPESGFCETLETIASRKSRFFAGARTDRDDFFRSFAQHQQFVEIAPSFSAHDAGSNRGGLGILRGVFSNRCAAGVSIWTASLCSQRVAAYGQGLMCFLGQATGDPDLSRWNPQFHSAALILTVVSLGKWLESLARDSADDLWGGIEALLPREACVWRDGREMIIPGRAVAVGDVVLVAPGERIPVDGEVMEGLHAY